VRAAERAPTRDSEPFRHSDAARPHLEHVPPGALLPLTPAAAPGAGAVFVVGARLRAGSGEVPSKLRRVRVDRDAAGSLEERREGVVVEAEAEGRRGLAQDALGRVHVAD